MKILTKLQFKVTLMVLAMVLAISGVLGVALNRNAGTSGGSETNINTDVNTVSEKVEDNGLTEEKAKAKFDVSETIVNENEATFTGYKAASSKEIGLVCEATYNKETGTVKITVVNANSGEVLLETNEGLLVDCGENKFDVVFEKDGEV